VTGKQIGAESPLRLFLVAGEHSGDALGARLMSALKARVADGVTFAGVGGEAMAAHGLASIFPLHDVAVMGPLNILAALPRLVRRVHQTVDAALAFKPDAVIIIDSPEFTHPIAKRIRRRAPDIPIINYVSPSVWAWRPGRAKKMRGYIDEVLALLPFEPAAHSRLGGPHCTYVGHPLIERMDEIANADTAGLACRLGIAPNRDVLVVLPGSRRSEAERLLGAFGETVALLAKQGRTFDVIIPTVPHLREQVHAAGGKWGVPCHVVDGARDGFCSMRIARAALAASGTVTLELALCGTPMVVAYKVDAVAAPFLRRLIKGETVVLANLVLGENAFPEFLQEDCTAEKMAPVLSDLLGKSARRDAQVAALARIPDKLKLDNGSPSEAAANAVLAVLASRGKMQRS
jgi:lipid-A-disaccharide synthase